LRVPNNVAIYNNDLDFKDFAVDMATHYHSNIGVFPNHGDGNWEQQLSAVAIDLPQGAINSIVDGNRTQESLMGLGIGSGFRSMDIARTVDNDNNYASPVYWLTAVNNEFGVDLGRGEGLGQSGPATLHGIVIWQGVPDGGVPTLGLAIRNNTVVARDAAIRNVEGESLGYTIKGAGLVTVPFEGFGTRNPQDELLRLWSADHFGPNYVVFEHNDVTATQGYLNEPLSVFLGGHPHPYGFGWVAEGVTEHLAFYKNTFDSGVAAKAVEMNFNLNTDFTDLVSRYPGAEPLHDWRDYDGTPNIPPGYRFHVFHGNQYLAAGSLLAPNQDYGYEDDHPNYNATLVANSTAVRLAPLPTLHLSIQQGDSRTGLTTRIWGTDFAALSLDSIAKNQSWLTITDDQYDSLSNSWDVEFDVSTTGLAVGRHVAVITALDSFSGLEIELLVFVDVI
jgi:hypothetical protein